VLFAQMIQYPAPSALATMATAGDGECSDPRDFAPPKAETIPLARSTQ